MEVAVWEVEHRHVSVDCHCTFLDFRAEKTLKYLCFLVLLSRLCQYSFIWVPSSVWNFLFMINCNTFLWWMKKRKKSLDPYRWNQPWPVCQWWCCPYFILNIYLLMFLFSPKQAKEKNTHKKTYLFSNLAHGLVCERMRPERKKKNLNRATHFRQPRCAIKNIF